MKRIISTLLIVTLLTFCTVVSASAVETTASEDGTTVVYPSESDVIEKIKELNIDLSTPDTFTENYSLDKSAYNAGKLTDETKTSALNLLNLYRYIAGLPSDVEIKDSYEVLAQTGALVNAANDLLTHYPEQPDGMSDDLYRNGYAGCSHSNIAWNYNGLENSIVDAWMNDSDEYNIATMGHRRWVLNPAMKYTAFGSVGNYTAMYAMDRSREEPVNANYVAWPGANTPLELFQGSVFTFTLGKDYDVPDKENISVTVTSDTLNTTWTLNNETTDGQLYVNNQNYGQTKCIIFKVTNFKSTDKLNIHIDGITKNGQDAPIDYNVNLFSVSTVEPMTDIIMMKPQTGADLDVTATSLLSSAAPKIKCTTSDASVVSVGTFIHSKKLGAYAANKGTAVITVNAGGEDKDIKVIVDNLNFYTGDVNGDDNVDIIDATVLQRTLLGLYLNKYKEYLSDANGDGDVNIIDVTAIQRYLVDVKGPWPIGKSNIAYFTR